MITVKRTFRGIYRNVVEIHTKSVALGVSIGEQAPLQHLIRREANAWDDVSGRKGRLLNLREIVLGIPIEFEKSDFNQGKIGFRPNLRQIEWIESKGPCFRVGHYLNEKGPSRIFAAIYTIEKVAP